MPNTPDTILRALAGRLKIDKPLVFLDLETTGPKVETDRIVQVAYAQVDPAGEVVRGNTLIDPGVPIPAGATKVHGITDAAVKGKPRFSAIAKALAARLGAAQAIGGFNVGRFDLPLLAREFGREGIDFDPEALPVLDAFTIFRTREPRTLSAAVKFYCNAEHETAHDAMGDVDATAAVLDAQLGRYLDLPVTVEGLAAVGRDPDALDRAGKIVYRDGDARLAFGKHSGVALRDVPRDFFAWMLGADFGSTTKEIVREAMAGRYPPPF